MARLTSEEITEKVEKRFIDQITHHLQGWKDKATIDFGLDNFNNELRSLESDPLYPRFNLATPEYVFIRFMGRMSISIGRRLGEIYDNVPRLLAAARFNLSPGQVTQKIEGLIPDICLLFENIPDPDDTLHIKTLVLQQNSTLDMSKFDGIEIEIRYNFNPNDSSRLRKDVKMAENLINNKLVPIYLIFSSISPREEAIARLKRAGWHFIVGQAAIDWAAALFGLDISSALDREHVQKQIMLETNQMMSTIKESYAFSEFIKVESEF
jgi:hypothetical protein